MRSVVLFATVLAACATAPTTAPVVVQGCSLTTAPPDRPAIVRTPCPLEVCLDTPNAAQWDRYESDLRAWSEDAWLRCRR